MKEEEKRLFFGAETFAPWPQEEPPGRPTYKNVDRVVDACEQAASVKRWHALSPTTSSKDRP